MPFIFSIHFLRIQNILTIQNNKNRKQKKKTMKRPSAVLTFDILIRLKKYRRELLKSHLQLVPQFPRANIVLGLHCISNHQGAFQFLNQVMHTLATSYFSTQHSHFHTEITPMAVTLLPYQKYK